MFRDWSVKPNYEIYRDLVFNQWWTNASGKTNANQDFTRVGFTSTYVTAGIAPRNAVKGAWALYD